MRFPQPPAAAWLLLLLPPPTAACTWSIQQLHQPRHSALDPSCSCPLQLGPFDGIFFDTYGEYYEDMHDFHTQLPRWVQKRVGDRHVPLAWSDCMPGTGVQVQGSSRSPVLLYYGSMATMPSPALNAACPLSSPFAHRLLRPGGVYTFFNGLAPDNMFFHLVYGEIARLELGRCAAAAALPLMVAIAFTGAVAPAWRCCLL
jgi:hypothetical protein